MKLLTIGLAKVVTIGLGTSATAARLDGGIGEGALRCELVLEADLGTEALLHQSDSSGTLWLL